MSTDNCCKYVEVEPVHVNRFDVAIEDFKTPCRLKADPGEQYCPRHKLIIELRGADSTGREKEKE